MQTSSSGERLLELTTQAAAGLSSQQATTLASILASLAGKLAENITTSSSELQLPESAQPSLQLSEQQLNQISEEDELKLLNFPSKREDLSTAIPLTVIFALLLVTGCIGNICTAIVIARPKNKYMHTATNYYLFSLAMSDFLFLILGLPQEMYTLWQRYPYAFGESFCIIRGYLSEASTYASILTISAFTVERYVAICHPLWAHTMSQLPRAITSIVIIWCLAAICAIPPAAELGIVTQHGPLTNRTLEQSAQCATKRTIYENMFVISAIVFFIVPMVIVTVLYILIAIELRRSSRMNNAIIKQTSSQLHQAAGQHQPHSIQSAQASGGAHHRHHCCARQHQSSHHLVKPKSQKQQLRRPVEAADKEKERDAADRRLLDGLAISERPQSAIGVERGPVRVECCIGPVGQVDARGHMRSKSPAASSLARFQLPFASKLCHQFLRAEFWSGYNLTATSAGPEDDDDEGELKRRPTSELGAELHPPASQTVNSDSSKLDAESQNQKATTRHTPVSRQHSPLSYHESLIQRGHPHSALDLSQPTSGDGQLAACHPHHRHQFGGLHAAPHHQLSLTQLPTNHHQQQRQLLLLNHHHNFKSFQHQHQQHQQQQQHSRRSNAASSKKSVIRMLVAVVVSFFICWVPFHAQRLLASYLAKHENRNQLLLDIYLKLTYISGVMYYLSSTINPLLYQLMSAKFRLAFKETFKCSIFKCAIFRRASTATQATAIGLNHSPTNSIRISEQPAASCSCQLTGGNSSARARFICELGAGRPGPLCVAPGKQRASSSNTDLHQQLAQDCCFQCCCQLQQHQNSAAFLPGVLSRFRGQLNASLTSLLRLGADQRAAADHCACCTYGIQPKEGVQDDQPSQTRDSSASATREKRPPVSSGGAKFSTQKLATCEPDQNGTSASLSLTQSTGPTDSTPKAKEFVNSENNSASHLQTNFPTHHTLLKFIRSPTPTHLDGLDQPTSLTRLSSREADDEDDQRDERESINQQNLNSNEYNTNQSPIDRQNVSNRVNADMRALIKATKQEDDFGMMDGRDESDPLVSTTLTTSASLTNEGAHSSVGSSPDQLGSTSQSTTNQARTLSNSSSRSSLALLANYRSDLAPSGRVMGVLSSVKSSAKRKLVGSKSTASPNPTMTGAVAKPRSQIQRRASWQQNQQNAENNDNDHALANQLEMKITLSDLNPDRIIPMEAQIVDQNGNERKESEAIDRDYFWPHPSLEAPSEIRLNSDETSRSSERTLDKPTKLTTLSDEDDDAKPPSISTNDTSSHSSGSSSITNKSHEAIPSHLLKDSTSAVSEHPTPALMNFGPVGI